MNAEETKDLKPGDPVYVQVGGIQTKYKQDEVAKVTPTGQIALKSGMRFNKLGHEIGGHPYHYALLLSVKDGEERYKLQQRMNWIRKKEEELKQKIGNLFRHKDILTTNQVTEVEAVLDRFIQELEAQKAKI